jgi:hypothetical protein
MTHDDFQKLLSSLKGLSPGQVQQLRRQLDRQFARPKQPPAKAAKAARLAAPREQPPTPDEFNRRLLAAGRIASLPDPALDIDDDDPADAPIAIQGEPLSETIIREWR